MMKKMVWILLMGLLCTGCSSQPENPSETSLETSTESTSSTTVATETASETAAAENTAESLDKENLMKQNLFSPFISHQTEDHYGIKGTIYLSDRRGLAKAEALADTEMVISGTVTPVEGQMQLLMEDAEGNRDCIGRRPE